MILGNDNGKADNFYLNTLFEGLEPGFSCANKESSEWCIETSSYTGLFIMCLFILKGIY